LTLLVGRREEHPVCKNGVMSDGVVICLQRGANDLRNGLTDATATPSSLASLKSRMVLPSGVGLPGLSLKRGR